MEMSSGKQRLVGLKYTYFRTNGGFLGVFMGSFELQEIKETHAELQLMHLWPSSANPNTLLDLIPEIHYYENRFLYHKKFGFLIFFFFVPCLLLFQLLHNQQKIMGAKLEHPKTTKTKFREGH
jgi:hypothetical protein